MTRGRRISTYDSENQKDVLQMFLEFFAKIMRSGSGVEFEGRIAGGGGSEWGGGGAVIILHLIPQFISNTHSCHPPPCQHPTPTPKRDWSTWFVNQIYNTIRLPTQSLLLTLGTSLMKYVSTSHRWSSDFLPELNISEIFKYEFDCKVMDDYMSRSLFQYNIESAWRLR